MIHMAGEAGLQNTIFDAVERRNDEQQLVLIDKIVEKLGSNLTGRKIALWGLAFKPETDDIRGAPGVRMARELSDRGAEVFAFDPQAMSVSAEALAGCQVNFVDDQYEATEGADALIVATEWRQFKQPDFRRLSRQLKAAIVFDGRNIYNPQRCADYGLEYVGIGRSSALYA